MKSALLRTADGNKGLAKETGMASSEIRHHRGPNWTSRAQQDAHDTFPDSYRGTCGDPGATETPSASPHGTNAPTTLTLVPTSNKACGQKQGNDLHNL